jgi:hypothetical protein
VRGSGKHSPLFACAAKRAAKKRHFPAAQVSVALSMFDSKDKERFSHQYPRRFKRNTSCLSKIQKNPSTLSHLQFSTIFDLSCDLPLTAGKAPSASNAEIVPHLGSLFPLPSDLPDPGTAFSCQEA